VIDLVTKQDVIKALKKCYDPEIGISLVDMGLIYDVQVKNDKVHIKMTLTTPACPMHAFMINDVEEKVKKLKRVKEVKVELVWDPPWTIDKMSKDAKKRLGLE